MVLVALIGAVLAKDRIAGAVLSGGVKAITGLDTQVGRTRVGLLNTSLGIQGLRISNPAGFRDRVMVDVPEVFVDYRLGAFMKGNVHLEVVRLHLAELDVIKASDGRLNLRSVKALEPDQATGEAQPKEAGTGPQFQIDLLEVRIGKVVYKDYTVSPPLVKEFNVNINERYQRITNPDTFTGLIVSRALMKTTVEQLANFDVKGLQASVTEGLKASAAQLTSTLTGSTEAAEQIGKDALGTAQETVAGATGTLKKLLGN